MHKGARRHNFFAVFLFVQLKKLRFSRYDQSLVAATTRLRANDVYTEFALRIAGFDDCNSGNAEMLMSHCAILTLLRTSYDRFNSSWKH